MPVYEYQCQKCGSVFEVTQGFKDDPIRTCQEPGCRGRVKKLFSAPAIIFKGSGFHVTDYGRGNGNGKKTPKRWEESKPGSECTTCEKATCAVED